MPLGSCRCTGRTGKSSS